MRFKEGTSVYTSDGQELGKVDRVVMDPHSKKVTHVIVKKGLLFTEDKVLPIDVIDVATESNVILKDDAGKLPELPKFKENYFQPVNPEEMTPHYPTDDAHPLYWYPTVGAARGGAIGFPFFSSSDSPHTTTTEKKIPSGTVPLKEGAEVMSADGEHVGNVERIFTESESERATHFVITEGTLLKERKLIPTLWASAIGEEKVQLAVGSKLLNNLPEYKR